MYYYSVITVHLVTASQQDNVGMPSSRLRLKNHVTCLLFPQRVASVTAAAPRCYLDSYIAVEQLSGCSE